MPCLLLLQGEEKSVVARHEVGHALVSTGEGWVGKRRATPHTACLCRIYCPVPAENPRFQHHPSLSIPCSLPSCSAAVAALLPSTQGLVEKLSIIPRSGGALGFTYIPPLTEDR